MNKKLMVVLALLVTMLSFTMPKYEVCANEIETPADDDIPPEPYICENCEWLANVYCAHETIYNSSWTHKTNCTITLYRSRAIFYCGNCGNSRYLLNDAGTAYAYHDCIRRHTKCVPNREVICSVGY